MNAHTPGKWQVSEKHPGLVLAKYTQSGGGMVSAYVAEVHGDDDNEGEMEANALLIAAAPNLLASLKELVAYRESRTTTQRDGSDGRYTRARAAIAKAEGR